MSATPACVEIPPLDGIDTFAGLQRVQGNRALYCKLLHQTARTQTDTLAQFDAAVANDDWSTAQRLIHSLKGVAGSIGAAELHHACARLEATAMIQIPDREARAGVDRALTRVLDAIATLPASRHAAAKPLGPTVVTAAPDPNRVARVLAELDALIAESNFVAVERLEAERGLLEDAGLVSQVRAIAAALDDYDFESAQAIIEGLVADRCVAEAS